MTGKNKCKLLKKIRKKIADENDISYVTSECKFQGECTGTCPKCEAEVRYLEQELDKRRKAGRAVAVAGIAAALVVTAAGCDAYKPQVDGDVAMVETTAETQSKEDRGSTVGLIMPTEEATQVLGELLPTEETILSGDVAWPAP